MKISTRQIGTATMVDITGRIILEETAVVRKTVCDLLDKNHKQIVMNLAAVEWIDSAGLGCLVGCFTSARKQNGDLKLFRPREKVRSVLRMTKLDTVLHILNNELEVADSFGQSSAASA